MRGERVVKAVVVWRIVDVGNRKAARSIARIRTYSLVSPRYTKPLQTQSDSTALAISFGKSR